MARRLEKAIGHLPGMRSGIPSKATAFCKDSAGSRRGYG